MISIYGLALWRRGERKADVVVLTSGKCVVAWPMSVGPARRSGRSWRSGSPPSRTIPSGRASGPTGSTSAAVLEHEPFTASVGSRSRRRSDSEEPKEERCEGQKLTRCR